VLWGSLTLSQAFFEAGEVDGVRLAVMPIAIGAGRGVFPAGQDPTLLSLLSAKTYDTGLIELEHSLGSGRTHGRPAGA
jgi:dihydrofolate reductase